MSRFEFIMVLPSMIIELGVAEILTGFARALLRPRLSINSWQPLLLAAIVLVALVQVWRKSWTLHGVAECSFPLLLRRVRVRDARGPELASARRRIQAGQLVYLLLWLGCWIPRVAV